MIPIITPRGRALTIPNKTRGTKSSFFMIGRCALRNNNHFALDITRTAYPKRIKSEFFPPFSLSPIFLSSMFLSPIFLPLHPSSSIFPPNSIHGLRKPFRLRDRNRVHLGRFAPGYGDLGPLARLKRIVLPLFSVPLRRGGFLRSSSMSRTGNMGWRRIGTKQRIRSVNLGMTHFSERRCPQRH